MPLLTVTCRIACKQGIMQIRFQCGVLSPDLIPLQGPVLFEKPLGSLPTNPAIQHCHLPLISIQAMA